MVQDAQELTKKAEDKLHSVNQKLEEAKKNLIDAKNEVARLAEASNKIEMEMLSRTFEETLPLVARVNNVADKVTENLGEYTDFVSEVELSKIAIDVSNIAPEDVEASYWSDPDEFDSAGENYGGSGLSSYISSSDDDGGD